MTPPINIDGTNENYSSVTIDGQTVGQITIDGQDVLRTIPDSGLLHDYDPTALSGFSDADPVGSWTDEAGAEDLTNATSSEQPTYQTNEMNGEPIIRFDTTDDFLEGSSAANWAFLSDGSDFSVYIVVSAATDTFNEIISTQGLFTGGRVGLSFVRENRSGVSSDAFRLVIGNGSNSVVSITLANEFPDNSDEIYTIQHDASANEYRSYRGKRNLHTTSPSATKSSSNPSVPMEVGAFSGSSLTGGSDDGRMLFYGTAHDTTTRESIIDSLANTYGITV